MAIASARQNGATRSDRILHKYERAGIAPGPFRDDKGASRPVSRVLDGRERAPAGTCPRRDGHSSGTCIAARLEQPTRTTGPGNRPLLPCGRASSLFGFAPGGACHAVPVAGSAVRSYRTFSPLPRTEVRGGSISVALSLGSPPPDVIRHRVSVEPGLSSPAEAGAAVRPTGGLPLRSKGRSRQAHTQSRRGIAHSAR